MVWRPSRSSKPRVVWCIQARRSSLVRSQCEGRKTGVVRRASRSGKRCVVWCIQARRSSLVRSQCEGRKTGMVRRSSRLGKQRVVWCIQAHGSSLVRGNCDSLTAATCVQGRDNPGFSTRSCRLRDRGVYMILKM